MPFQIDYAHTVVSFTARHMMISKVRGRFDKVSGTVNLNVDNPALTTVDIAIDAASINTNDAQRDGHLRSPDFLNAEVYPNLVFKSTKVEVTDKSHARLYGDLTIRDVTRPVVLDVEYVGQAKSPWGSTNYGFEAHTKINREEWGLNWNVALEAGGWLVGKDVQIDIEIELVQIAEPELVAVAA